VTRVYTRREAARRLRIGQRTLDRRQAEGLISYVKDGRRVLFREEDLVNYLEAHRVEARQGAA
jgi:excisionase family DNA binding protein